jgi:hypothetical protein
MKLNHIAMAAIAVFGLAGLSACATGHTGKKSLAEYCANTRNADTDICKVNTEIVGVDGRAKAAQSRADEAMTMATAARARADEAYTRQDNVYCETRTLNRTNVGTCSSGYTLVSCTQSRYTTRSGGPSIMREINDQQCRFNDRVLEMKVRCCMAGMSALPTEPVPEPAPRTRRGTSRTS